MKNADYKHWEQIEWPEFYFKFLSQKHFASTINIPSKEQGNIKFDAFREIPWDFRVDSTDAETYSVIANDVEVIADAVVPPFIRAKIP